MRKKRKRIYTMEESAVARARATKGSLKFSAKNGEDWKRWRRNFRRALWRNLGPMPERVPLGAEVLEKKDMGDHIREKVVFDSEKFMSVPAWVLIPRDRKRGQKLPAILCAHGHGDGKDPLVGLKVKGEEIEDYQHQMAKKFTQRGYVTISPDWRCFGERADSDKWVRRPGRDGCNVAALAVGYFGFNLLGLQIWDGMRTIDYLSSRREVDARRIGCIGVSFGGTMTTYLGALDNRVKVAVISCYLSTIYDALANKDANTCGSQFSPGLLKIGDISDVASLIAPKPLLVEIGEKDNCFEVNDAMSAYRQVEKAYRQIGAKDRIEVDLFPGPHEFSGRKAFDWFEEWL